MTDFNYIDTTGKSQTTSAPDAASALKNAPNIDIHSGVQALQNTGTDLSSYVPTSTTIDSSKLNSGNNTNIQVPSPTSDKTNDLINGLITGNQQQGLPSEQSLSTTINKNQGAIDQTTQKIQDLMTQLGYKASDTTNLENQVNIPGLQNQLSDLNTQLAQKKSDYDAQFQRIGAQNIPSLFVSGQLALAKAAAASDLGATAAQVQAAQGNLNTAFDTINKTISLKYQPIIDQIDQQLKFYQINKDQFSNAQSKLADRQSQILDLQKTAITNQQKILGDAATSVNDAIKSGQIDPKTGWQVYSDLLAGKISSSDAFAKLGILAPSNIIQNTNLGDAIAAIENGSYTTPANSSGALGKYQIIPKYWFSVIGLDPNNSSDIQKFLNTPSLQDNLFQTILSTLTQQYGGDQAKATAAYFGGDKAAQAYGTPQGDKISDGNMTVNQYVNTVLGNLNQQNTPQYGQYGLLSQVSGFNPQVKEDSDSFRYLQTYFNKGTVPSAYDIGLPRSSAALGNIQKRANDLYYQATGQSLPNALQLKSNNALISSNNKLENNLNIQEGTVGKNFALAIQNLDKNGINKLAQPINAFLDSIRNTMGDPAVAQYITQNGTLQNEVGNLIAIKNASGTTVSDKLASAQLVPKNASEDQQKAILKILLQEAQNGFNTIKKTSGDLYKQIDPLELNPNNPNRQNNNSIMSDISSLRSKYGY